jgi:hypothetical protein
VYHMSYLKCLIVSIDIVNELLIKYNSFFITMTLYAEW